MFNFFKKEKESKDLKDVLLQFENLKKNFDKLSQEVENLKRENRLNIQKIGLVRFNPFKEVGSNQSFSIALLDGSDSGIVISGLFNHQGSRVYGKPITQRKSEYPLSKEEEEAIERAVSPKISNF